MSATQITNNIIFECDDFIVVDYTKNIKRMKEWIKRRLDDVKYVIYHHTAGQRFAFPRGMVLTNQYIRFIRKWPAVPYHLYVPYVQTGEKIVVYLLNNYNEKTWHTKMGNNHGVGVVFQGNFSKYEPSERQKEVAPLLFTEYLQPLFNLTDENLLGHFNFGKAACPGKYLEGLCRAYQDGYGYMYN